MIDTQARDAAATTEERLLVEFARSRHPRVLEDLVQRYRPLARSLALRYRGGSEPVEDLFQVAELGLVKSIQGFDPDLGKPFTAYAVPTILGEVKRHFRDRVWNLRLPRGLGEATMTVSGVEDKLTERLGRSPNVEEIADNCDLDPEEVSEAKQAAEARYTLSLEAPRRADPDAPAAIDTIGDADGGFDRVEAEMAAETAALDRRERLVLALRFQRGMTQQAIGDRLGVSQMQVSRISRRALRKLLAAVQGGDGAPTS
jgi:RNA polymerase sigma-B factor